jgi:hypothetical protein
MILFLILGIAFLAFGIKTFGLGYFHDDWHHVYYSYYFGLDGLKQFLFFDSRPFAYIFYWPFFSLLGFDPLGWHFLALFLRFFTVLVFFLCFNLVLPNHQKQNGLVALLFLIYPVYQVQPNSVSYALHWFTYLSFMVSLLFMVLAVRRPRFFVVFTVLSLLLEIFHLFLIEYFAGVELIRFFILFYLLRENPMRNQFGKALVRWSPYFLILVVYTFFRASYSQILGYDRNTPIILLGMFTDPVNSIKFLIQSSVRDVVDVLLTAWNYTYDPANIDFSIYSNLWIWSFAILTGMVSWVYLKFIRDNEYSEDDQAVWSYTVMVSGLIFIVLGFLPTWISGRTFFQVYDLFDDRFALPSMFGAGMVWVGGIFYIVKRQSHRYIIVCTLIGLAVGLQLRTNQDYSQGWDKQSQFYWQLYWRAPSIEPNTAFISEGEILPYMGKHPTTYAINTLYSQNHSLDKLSYSFFSSGENIGGSWENFKQGVELDDVRFGSSFIGTSRNSLTILYAPENDQCLWILRPEDKYIRNMPSLTYQSLPLSNLARIDRDPLSDQYPADDIFGPEPTHTWCYFYEKAELARQYDDWHTVTQLWSDAQSNDFRPGSGAEYLVFIEGFIHIDDWENAKELTLASNKYGNNIRPTLCEFWEKLLLSTETSPAREKAIPIVSDKLDCGF